MSPPPPATARYAGQLGLPEGWYHLGRAADLPEGGVQARTLWGEEWVLWRGPDGPVLQQAWCPHLGAHLGQGGTVDHGCVRCPFHGFAFAPDGTCVRTGYGTPPPRKARLLTRPVIVRHGLLLAWPGPTPPTWAPDDPGDEGWSDPVLHTWELRGHPQETTENSVDVGHFSWIHGYREVATVTPVTTEGPRLTATYRFLKPLVGTFAAPQEIDLTVWGLGYSRVLVRDALAGARFRILVLPTPLAADRLRLTLGFSVEDPDRADPSARWWRWLPRWMARGVVAPLVARGVARDVEQDFQVWGTKSYLDRPALAEGDGPLGRYRAWARQFYPHGEPTGHPPEAEGSPAAGTALPEG